MKVLTGMISFGFVYIFGHSWLKIKSSMVCDGATSPRYSTAATRSEGKGKTTILRWKNRHHRLATAGNVLRTYVDPEILHRDRDASCLIQRGRFYVKADSEKGGVGLGFYFFL
uniref:Uncharacterized protein LOC114327315 n=1 Tax=Diabrotica virgifera virgifera TaxID=50390 RepID=A0A6P7F859_DIAVI